MERQKRIWLYGNSVILGTLCASLKRSYHYEVTTVGPSLFSQKQETEKPDVIFFDLDSPCPQDAFLLLNGNPGLKIIGISPDTNIVKVWSGKQLKELSTRDLMEVINERENI